MQQSSLLIILHMECSMWSCLKLQLVLGFVGMFRGRAHGKRNFAKEEKYEVFPEIKEYPDVNLKQKEEFNKIIAWGNALQKFWVSSPYHLEASGQDSERNGGIRKPPLSDYMKMTDDYVPAELVAKNVRHINKKVRWDPQSDLQKLDLFEKLDRPQGQDDGEKEKKEDEDDDEDNENIEEEEEDSGDDYDQNPDFDDDEDDFNMDEDLGGDEGYY